jgi:hypothetical protein
MIVIVAAGRSGGAAGAVSCPCSDAAGFAADVTGGMDFTDIGRLPLGTAARIIDVTGAQQ